MKALQRILITLLICFCFIFAAAYAFLLLQGKSLIVRQLESLTQKKVGIGYTGLTLPFNLEIKKLNIEGLAKIDYISASLSIPGLLTGKIVLNDLKIVRPEIDYEKKTAQAEGPQLGIILLPGVSTKAKKSARQAMPPVAFKHLVIKDGMINFRDYSVGTEGIKITVKGLALNLTNLYLYPHPAQADFTLTAKIPWQEGQVEGRIESQGWLNLFKGDMQASLKITDIDGIYLYPYYSQWADIEKAGIEKAKLNVTSDIKGTSGDIAAQCRLTLSDIVFKQQPQGEEGDDKQKIMAAVMDIFSALSRTQQVVFNFTLKGKMPRFY